MTASDSTGHRISGHRARAARDAAGLLQRDVAERLGIAAACVSHWETGRYVPDNDGLLRRYAAVLGVEVEELFDPDTVLEPDDDPVGPTPEIVVRQGFAPQLVPGTTGGRRVVRVGGDPIGNSGP